MSDIESNRKREQYVVNEMIHLYCRKRHKGFDSETGQLCYACQQLADYAKLRSEQCPFMEKKTFCSSSRVNCYRPEMREKIRQVMRYSGPRLILSHPILALWHVIYSMKEKRKQKEERTP